MKHASTFARFFMVFFATVLLICIIPDCSCAKKVSKPKDKPIDVEGWAEQGFDWTQMKLRACPKEEIAISRLAAASSSPIEEQEKFKCPVTEPSITLSGDERAYELWRLDECCRLIWHIDCLKHDKNPDARTNCADALHDSRDPRVIKPLIHALLRDPSAAVRASAAESLGYLRSKSAIEPLKRALKDSFKGTRISAAYALLMCGETKKPLPIIIEQTKDSSVSIRRKAMRSLGQIKGDRPIKVLLGIFNNKQETDEIRCYAAEALRQSENKKAVPSLTEVLKEVNSDKSYFYIPVYAARALVATGAFEKASPTLKEIAKDESLDEAVRIEALIGLGEIGTGEALDILRGFLNDKNNLIRNGANGVLKGDTFQGGRMKQ